MELQHNQLFHRKEHKLLQGIDDLAILFNKIENGNASEEERLEYDLSIKASCMDEGFLKALIEKKAKEMKGD